MNLWNLRAPLYDLFRKPWPLNAILKTETRHIRELLAGIDCGQGRVLDIGCGLGHSLNFLPQEGQVFAFDKSQQMVKRTFQAGIRNVVAAEAELLPVVDNSFDVILAIGLTEYLKLLPQFFTEIKRAGKNNSFLLCTSSPPGIFSLLRNIGGSKIYQRISQNVIQSAEGAGLVLFSQRHFFSQDAFLFQIIKKKPLKAPESYA